MIYIAYREINKITYGDVSMYKKQLELRHVKPLCDLFQQYRHVVIMCRYYKHTRLNQFTH